MRPVAAIVVLALCGCDPVTTITMRFPAAPGARVTAFWIDTFGTRTYPGRQTFTQLVSGPELVHSATECCGTVAAYREEKLRFVACVDAPGADPVLVCGRLGPAPSPTVSKSVPGTTCDALIQTFGHADLDTTTCTLTTRH